MDGAFGADVPRGLGLRIAVRAKIPRTAIAPVAVAFVPVAERPILARATVGKPAALAFLPVSEPRPLVLSLTLALVRRPLRIGLRGIRRDVRLRLKPLLRLLIWVLPLRRRGEAIRQGAEIAIVLDVFVVFSRRSRLTTLGKRLRSLRGRDQAKVVLSML